MVLIPSSFGLTAFLILLLCSMCMIGCICCWCVICCSVLFVIVGSGTICGGGCCGVGTCGGLCGCAATFCSSSSNNFYFLKFSNFYFFFFWFFFKKLDFVVVFQILVSCSDIVSVYVIVQFHGKVFQKCMPQMIITLVMWN